MRRFLSVITLVGALVSTQMALAVETPSDATVKSKSTRASVTEKKSKKAKSTQGKSSHKAKKSTPGTESTETKQ